MKNNTQTLFSLFAVILAFTALAFTYNLIGNKSNVPVPSTVATSTPISFADAIKNGTYTFGEETVKLTNGTFSQPVAPNSATKSTISIFGEPVYGDLDTDGDQDAALMLTTNEGGSGTFFYAVLVMNNNGTYTPTNTMLLGDRIAPQNINIINGRAIYNYAERKASEPMTASPSIGKSLYVNYNKATNQIGELVQNFEGEASPSKMTLTMKKWEWVKTATNDGKVTTPKKKGVFTLTFGTDGRVSVGTDCNNMGGTYTVNGEKLTFSQMMSTMMYCEGSQEQEFSSPLNDVASYLFTSKGELILEIKMDSGTIMFK